MSVRVEDLGTADSSWHGTACCGLEAQFFVTLRFNTDDLLGRSWSLKHVAELESYKLLGMQLCYQGVLPPGFPSMAHKARSHRRLFLA